MKVVITNKSLATWLIILCLSLPFVSAFTSNQHRVLYNLSQYENYVPPHGVFESYCEDTVEGQKAHKKARAEFLQSKGISRGELWMSRARFLVLGFTFFIAAISFFAYLDELLTNKRKFRVEVDLKNPFPKETEEEKLERLGRKLLSLPVDEQEYLLNRLKEQQDAVTIYDPNNWKTNESL